MSENLYLLVGLFIIFCTVLGISFVTVPPWVKRTRADVQQQIIAWAVEQLGMTQTEAERWVTEKFHCFIDGAECHGGLNLRNRATVRQLPQCLILVIGDLDIRGTGIAKPPNVRVIGRTMADPVVLQEMQDYPTNEDLLDSKVVRSLFGNTFGI